MIAPWQIDELDEDWLSAFLETAPQSIAQHNQKLRTARNAFIKNNLPRYH